MNGSYSNRPTGPLTLEAINGAFRAVKAGAAPEKPGPAIEVESVEVGLWRTVAGAALTKGAGPIACPFDRHGPGACLCDGTGGVGEVVERQGALVAVPRRADLPSVAARPTRTLDELPAAAPGLHPRVSSAGLDRITRECDAELTEGRCAARGHPPSRVSGEVECACGAVAFGEGSLG